MSSSYPAKNYHALDRAKLTTPLCYLQDHYPNYFPSTSAKATGGCEWICSDLHKQTVQSQNI